MQNLFRLNFYTQEDSLLMMKKVGGVRLKYLAGLLDQSVARASTREQKDHVYITTCTPTSTPYQIFSQPDLVIQLCQNISHYTYQTYCRHLTSMFYPVQIIFNALSPQSLCHHPLYQPLTSLSATILYQSLTSLSATILSISPSLLSLPPSSLSVPHFSLCHHPLSVPHFSLCHHPLYQSLTSLSATILSS